MNRADGPCGRAHLDQPADGRDPGDGGGDPEPAEERVQPSLAGASPARLDLQDVRPRGCGRDGSQPGLDVLRLCALHVQGAPRRELRRRELVVRPHLRERLLRLELDPQRDDPLGQRRVRAAHARRHGAERVAETARRMGVRSPARRQRRVRALDRARLRRGLASRSRLLATQRSPREASTRSRWRSAASCSPDGREDTEAGWGVPEAATCALGGHRCDRDPDPRAEHPVRDRHAGGLRPAGSRKDRERTRSTPTPGSPGYTPGLATTVWIGYTKGEIPMENVHGISVSGGSFPAEIWRLFMEPALEGTEPTPFPEPSSWPDVAAVHAWRVRADLRPERDARDDRGGDDRAGAAGDRAPSGRASVSAGVPELLSIEDALERILETRAPARRPRTSSSPTPRGACLPSPRIGTGRPPAVPELGDGRVRRARGRHAGRRWPLPSASPRGARPRRRSPREQQPGSRRVGQSPTARTRSCRSRTSSSTTAGSRSRRRRVHGSAHPAAGRRRRAGRARGRRRDASRPGAGRRAGRGRDPRSDVRRAPARQRPRDGKRAPRAGRGARTGSDLRVEPRDRRSRARARGRRASSCCPSSPTTRPRTWRRSRAGSTPTCS